MKKTLFCLTVLTAALVSCQKNEMPASEEVQGIPMTLTASLPGESGTKTTVSPDGTGLKSTWDAEESISVVTLDGEGKLLFVDTFTSSGTAGRTNAEFEGTFTGGKSPAKVIVIYPALEETGGFYRTPAYKAYDGRSYSLLSNASIGSYVFSATDNQPLRQASDGDFAHFKNYCVMTGNVNLTDIQSDKLTVTLRNLTTVFKIVAMFPESCKGKGLSQIIITSCEDSGATHRNIFSGVGGTAVDMEKCGYNPEGNRKYDWFIYSSFTVPDSGVTTFYMPVIGMDGAKNEREDRWFMMADLDVGDVVLLARKEFEKDVTYEAGKMYTVNVTFSK